MVTSNGSQNIFLVGGFGQSAYLKQQLEISFGQDVNISRPKNAWTAVVRGAVLCGVEKNDLSDLSLATPCRRHYGICADQVFSELKHDPAYRKENPLMNNNDIVKGHIQWLLSKGDLILSNKPTIQRANISVKFGKSTDRSGRLPIYWYDDDRHRRPDNIQDSKKSKFKFCP
jgi:hypothetical protein